VELGAGNDSAGVDSAEAETPIHAGKRAKKSSTVAPKQTPLAELKLEGRRNSMESPPQNARRGLRSSYAGLPTPITSSRGVSRLRANDPSKVLVRMTPEPPEPEPISISSSPLSPLTDLQDSSPCSQAPAQNSSPIFNIPALPLHTPCHQRVGDTKSGLSPPRHPAMAVDSEEELVPTSQSQDLKPFIISPPHPGGSSLLKDTTPKSLRQSQGYIK
jgi:hypothetical protein